MLIRSRHPSARSCNRTSAIPGCWALAALVALVGYTGCERSSAPEEILVGAAMSLRDAMTELGRRFEHDNPGARVHFHFASSGTIAAQIEKGASIDVFAAASVDHMERLVRVGLVRPGESRAFASNRLVVIQPRGRQPRLGGLGELDRAGRIALGNPRSVPAGRYGRELLEHLGLWAELQPRLIFAENVRQVVDWVARGEVDAGLVYATDVRGRAAEIDVLADAPLDSHSPIVYTLAMIATSPHKDLALRFLELVLSASGQLALGTHGFEPAGAR